MIDQQQLIKCLQAEPTLNETVVNVMAKIDRKAFVPKELAALAYENHPLSIGYEQTISQPYIVARMTSLLYQYSGAHKRVLEIGTGSGYQAAILSQLYQEVYSLERVYALYDKALQRLHEYPNVQLFWADGHQGLSNHAPFDAIICTAAIKEAVPQALLSQLSQKGCLIAPIERGGGQQLVLIQKSKIGLSETPFDWVRFVPCLPGTINDES